MSESAFSGLERTSITNSEGGPAAVLAAFGAVTDAVGGTSWTGTALLEVMLAVYTKIQGMVMSNVTIGTSRELTHHRHWQIQLVDVQLRYRDAPQLPEVHS